MLAHFHVIFQCDLEFVDECIFSSVGPRVSHVVSSLLQIGWGRGSHKVRLLCAVFGFHSALSLDINLCERCLKRRNLLPSSPFDISVCFTFLRHCHGVAAVEIDPVLIQHDSFLFLPLFQCYFLHCGLQKLNSQQDIRNWPTLDCVHIESGGLNLFKNFSPTIGPQTLPASHSLTLPLPVCHKHIWCLFFIWIISCLACPSSFSILLFYFLQWTICF